MVITNRRIPGLELRLPAQTVIRDIDGNNVTEISMTAVPVDRPPFPLPPSVNVPVFFTIQPGGSVLIPPRAQVIYPNFTAEPAGMRINFWNYDPTEKGWYIYGQGTVTSDGRRIVPDPGVVIYEFSGVMIGTASRPPGPAPGSCAVDGDPVDLGTGLFILNDTDLVLTDVLPLSLTRTYRPGDSASYSFGIGAVSWFDLILYDATPSGQHWKEVYLILSDGGRIRYDRISPGTGWVDAVLENTTSPTIFYKSRIKWNGTGWDLTLKNGTVFVWGDVAPLQSIRDRFGNQITILHSNGQYGNVTRLTSPNGRWIDFTYDSSNRITQARDNVGRVVNYTYDASGRLWKVTNPLGGVKEYGYDSLHRMTSIKNPRGIIYVTNEYDSNGRISRQVHADGGVYQFSYTLDGIGKVTQTDVTDPRGNHRVATFNSTGYVLTNTRTCCSGSITIEHQTGTDIITSVTDQLGRRTAFATDSMGNVTSMTRLAGTAQAVTTTYSYEPTFSQLTIITDPLGHSVSLAYDSKGNATTMTDQLGHTYSFSYNQAGQVTSLTDPVGSTMQFVYDAGDIVSASDPTGTAGTAFFDGAGRLLTFTDPLGRVARNEYDALGRLTRTVDPLPGTTQYAHDADGNIVSVTEARGGVTSYTYDDMDRLVTRTDPLLRVESYQHDLNGNVTRVTDRKGQVANYTYDALNRLTQIQYGDLSTTTYSYDAASRLSQVADSISGTIIYSYDTLDSVTSEATPQGTVSYTYDAAERRTSMTVPGQPTTNYTYDNANRLTQITQGSAAVTIGYDPAGRRTTLTLPNAVVAQFSYDAGSKPTGINYTRGGVAVGNLTYAYDAAGRRTAVGGSFARTGLPQAIASTSYNAANQQTAFGVQSLSYDLNGNLTSDGVNTYTWNARDQLSSIAGPGLTASFQYDGFGRRISKALNGTTTSFLYDGGNAVQEQVGGVATANILAGGLDEVFTRSDSSGNWNFLADGLGSTLALTDSSGELQTQYTYEAFGNTTISGPSSGNPSQFTARENDATGLYYYRARYYSPQLGRFVSQDPLGFDTDVNFYAYVGNSPLNAIDPEGLDIVFVSCRPLFYLSWAQIFKIWRHCYILIRTESASGSFIRQDTWGILGNPGSTQNQIPRKNDGRNVGGTCKPVPGVYASCEVETLRSGLDAAEKAKTCPACGENYRLVFLRGGSIDGYNSNTWVFNMLLGAGLTPPPQSRAPGYHKAPGKWY